MRGKTGLIAGTMAGLVCCASAFSVSCGARTPLRVKGSTSSADSTSSTGGAASSSSGTGGNPPMGVVQLALGAGHSCARTLDGNVYCWGENDHGQVGAPITAIVFAPTRVALPGPALTIAAGSYATCAILENGVNEGGPLYCWGANADSELGQGPGADSSAPVEVLADGVTSVALGEAHACAMVNPNRQIQCWGRNASGQVGNHTTGAPVPSPVVVEDGAIAIAAGAFHSVAIVNDANGRSIEGWGTNESLQTGSPGPTLFPFPSFAVATQDDQIRSGHGDHSCSFGSGPVTCWGANASGQLGRGMVSEAELPSFVNSEIGFNDIAVGFVHTCGLSGGTVFCWGGNSQGQLGNGSTSDSPFPFQVSGLSGAIAIAAGTLHTCAFLSPEDIRCWGANDFGQLGDGTTNASLTPISISLPTQ